MPRKVLALDFDGVMNTYAGWRGENVLYKPREGLKEFLEAASKDFKLVIYSTRPSDKIKEWLVKYELDAYFKEVSNGKPKASAYLDDRAFRFNGDFNEALEALKDTTPFWEKK